MVFATWRCSVHIHFDCSFDSCVGLLFQYLCYFFFLLFSLFLFTLDILSSFFLFFYESLNSEMNRKKKKLFSCVTLEKCYLRKTCKGLKEKFKCSQSRKVSEHFFATIELKIYLFFLAPSFGKPPDLYLILVSNRFTYDFSFYAPSIDLLPEIHICCSIR